MVTEQYIDPEIFEAAVRASRNAYRDTAELVAPRLSTTGAGRQMISEEEWKILTTEMSDTYGDAFLDAMIAAGILFRVLPSDADLIVRLEVQDAAVVSLASTMRELLDEYLFDMLEEGVPVDEIRDRLFDTASSPLNSRKADMMARTATNTAVNAGFEATFRAARVPAVSWITRRDDLVRDAHVAVDRDIVPTGSMFIVGGYEARYPGDPSLPIGLRINCRCQLGWVDGEQVKRAVNATKAEIYGMARQLDIPGRSRMRKPELQIAVMESMCLQGLAAGTDCPSLLDDMNMTALLSHARLGQVRGRYRMRKPELLDAVKAKFTTADSPRWLGFASILGSVPMTVTRITALADDVINGEPVSIAPQDAADLIEILGRHTEPVDLTLVRATPVLFTKVADNPLSRDEMPQIPEDLIDEFRSFLEADGVTVELRDVDPVDVFATQNQLDGRKVGKMITAIRNDQFTPEHPAFVSSDGYILDGHHRWAALAALSLDGSERLMVTAWTSVRIETLLGYADEFAAAHDIESKSHGMAWDASQPRHPRGNYNGGRWRSFYDGAGRPMRRMEVTSRPSVFDRQQSADWNEERERIGTYEREHRIVESPNREQMERFADMHGQGVESVFGEGSVGVTTIPFPQASRRKDEPLYDKAAVADILAQPIHLSSFDPRTLHASQRGVTREGVDYYVDPDGYKAVGLPFADQHEKGNQYPVIYRNPRTEQYVILSGHHRAVAALVTGRPVQGILVDPRIRVIRARRPKEDED